MLEAISDNDYDQKNNNCEIKVFGDPSNPNSLRLTINNSDDNQYGFCESEREMSDIDLYNTDFDESNRLFDNGKRRNRNIKKIKRNKKEKDYFNEDKTRFSDLCASYTTCIVFSFFKTICLPIDKLQGFDMDFLYTSRAPMRKEPAYLVMKTNNLKNVHNTGLDQVQNSALQMMDITGIEDKNDPEKNIITSAITYNSDDMKEYEKHKRKEDKEKKIVNQMYKSSSERSENSDGDDFDKDHNNINMDLSNFKSISRHGHDESSSSSSSSVSDDDDDEVVINKGEDITKKNDLNDITNKRSARASVSGNSDENSDDDSFGEKCDRLYGLSINTTEDNTDFSVENLTDNMVPEDSDRGIINESNVKNENSDSVFLQKSLPLSSPSSNFFDNLPETSSINKEKRKEPLGEKINKKKLKKVISLISDDDDDEDDNNKEEKKNEKKLKTQISSSRPKLSISSLFRVKNDGNDRFDTGGGAGKNINDEHVSMDQMEAAARSIYDLNKIKSVVNSVEDSEFKRLLSVSMALSSIINPLRKINKRFRKGMKQKNRILSKKIKILSILETINKDISFLISSYKSLKIKIRNDKENNDDEKTNERYFVTSPTQPIKNYIMRVEELIVGKKKTGKKSIIDEYLENNDTDDQFPSSSIPDPPKLDITKIEF